MPGLLFFPAFISEFYWSAHLIIYKRDVDLVYLSELQTSMSKVKSKIRKLKGKEEEETKTEEAEQQGSELLCCVPDVKGGLLIVLS